MWSGLNGRKTSAQFSDSAPKFQISRKWPEEQFKSWLKKGWELAKKVRAKLPAEVDLFYEWKSFKKYGLNIVHSSSGHPWLYIKSRASDTSLRYGKL